jgi:Tfp pilus assembly protein PilF
LLSRSKLWGASIRAADAKSTGRAKDAEQSFRQAVSIYGKTLGGEHPDYTNALENLAFVCQRRDFVTAEALFNRVLDIRKTVFGPEHHDVATSLDDLAGLQRAEGKPAEAAATTRRRRCMNALWQFG